MYFLRRWQRSIATTTLRLVDIASLISSFTSKVATLRISLFIKTFWLSKFITFQTCAVSKINSRRLTWTRCSSYSITRSKYIILHLGETDNSRLVPLACKYQRNELRPTAARNNLFRPGLVSMMSQRSESAKSLRVVSRLDFTLDRMFRQDTDFQLILNARLLSP